MVTKSDDPARFRIELTASCRDCDALPKVADAGRTDTSAQVQIMHNGIRVVAGGYYGAWMAEIIERLNGHHEPQEELIFHSILAQLPPKATMLELGGFWSYYSLWFLNEAPLLRRAIVVEPDPGHLNIGRRNATLNNACGIEFLQASVGLKSLKPRPFQSESSGTVIIPQVSVPDLVAAHSVNHLEILHSDTQGAELDVIRSCETLLRARRIDFVVISTHAHQISGDPLTHQRSLALLEDFGGRILAEHDVHESFSGDGLIAAYFGRRQLHWVAPKMSYNRYSKAIFENPLYDLSDAHERLRSSAAHEAQLTVEANALRGETNALKAETTALRAEATALRAEANALRAEANVQREASTEASNQLEAEKQRVLAAESELRALKNSTSWKMTEPLRRVARKGSPNTRLYLRRAAKATWWGITPWRIPARIRLIRERNTASRKAPLAESDGLALAVARQQVHHVQSTSGSIGSGFRRVVDLPDKMADPPDMYKLDGWVVYRNVVDDALLAEAREHIDWIQKQHPTVRPEQLGHTLMTNDPFWVRLVADDRLLDIAEQFVGPNIALFASAYLCKPAHDGQPVLWHQDSGYWPLDPMEVVTLWLAIDDAIPENGCMRVIPGSHNMAVAPILPRTDIPNALSSGMDESLVDEAKAVDVVLRAGDVSVHHPNIIHGSNANLSSRRRCGLTIRYIPTTTRIVVGENECFPSAFLLRGKSVPGLNRYNPWPRYDPTKHMRFRGCQTFGHREWRA